MKKLRISLMLFLGVLASGSLMGMGTIRVDIIPGESERAQVDVLEAPNSQFTTELKDSKGKVIYSDEKKVSSLDFEKNYDFSKLPNGKYIFEVKQGDEIDYNNLLVDNGNVQILGQEDQVAPDFKLDGKYLDFTYPNTTKEKSRLLLYDNQSKKWIFQERLDPEFDIQQSLNLAGLHTGNYKAVLINGDTTYDYNFYIG